MGKSEKFWDMVREFDAGENAILIDCFAATVALGCAFMLGDWAYFWVNPADASGCVTSAQALGSAIALAACAARLRKEAKRGRF